MDLVTLVQTHQGFRCIPSWEITSRWLKPLQTKKCTIWTIRKPVVEKMDVANQDIHGQMMSISVWLSQWNLINAKIVDMNPLLSTAQFNHSAGLVVGLTFFRCLECWSAMTSPFLVRWPHGDGIDSLINGPAYFRHLDVVHCVTVWQFWVDG